MDLDLVFDESYGTCERVNDDVAVAICVVALVVEETLCVLVIGRGNSIRISLVIALPSFGMRDDRVDRVDRGDPLDDALAAATAKVALCTSLAVFNSRCCFTSYTLTDCVLYCGYCGE